VTDLATWLEDWPQDCEVLFVDEATVRRPPTLTAQWCLSDAIPEVPTGDDHSKVHVYGAVAPLTGQTHHHISPILGKGAFAYVLRHLLRYYGGKRLRVIHDGAEQHKGAPSTTALKDAEGRLSLKRPPAYAPELNPQERLWKGMRRVVTHKHWFETLSEETQALRDFFCYLIGRKTQVRQLCGLKTPESLLVLL
jgi:transposase